MGPSLLLAAAMAMLPYPWIPDPMARAAGIPVVSLPDSEVPHDVTPFPVPSGVPPKLPDSKERK